MFNKERFHNALAIALGYEQIVKDKRYNIIVDEDVEDPKVTVKDVNGNTILKFKVSEIESIKYKGIHLSNDLDVDKRIKMIIDATHQAYLKATIIQF